jgi:Domain of unknown function (DUF6249)
MHCRVWEVSLDPEEVIVLMTVLIIIAGIAVIWMAMQSRRQIREMEHRERLAMIERGVVPPPEVDPERFERTMAARRTARVTESRGGARARSAGVIMIGLGLALMMLISFAAEAPSVGIGIGGAFAVLGAAFFFNGLLIARSEPDTTSPSYTSSTISPPSNSSRAAPPPPPDV